MRLTKKKLFIVGFLLLFVALTSFQQSAEMTPCWYSVMYFEPTFSKPAWGDYGTDWICTDEFAPYCTYVYNDTYMEFELCLRGTRWSYTK